VLKLLLLCGSEFMRPKMAMRNLKSFSLEEKCFVNYRGRKNKKKKKDIAVKFGIPFNTCQSF
jgi:hypothetical protein